MSWFKKIVLGFVVTTVAVAFSLGALTMIELGFRSVTKPDKGRLIDVELFPYAPYTISRQPGGLVVGKATSILDKFFGHGPCDAEGGVTARFNAEGFRSPSFPDVRETRGDALRVVIVGGSAAMSWNIGEACTLDQRLKEKLRRANPGRAVQVFNLANAAWKSFQELSAVQLYLHRIEPDVMVHFSGFNDMEHAASMPINHGYSQQMVETAFVRYAGWVKAGVLDFFRDFRVGAWVHDALRSRVSITEGGGEADNLPLIAEDPGPGRVKTAVSFPLELEAIAARTDFDPYNEEVVDNYMRNSAFMADAARRAGARVIEVLQPTLYLKTPRSEVEERVIGNGYVPNINFTVQGYLRIGEAMQQRDENETDLTFIDMSRVFDGDKATYFGDNVHFSADGYDKVAAELARAIQAILN